MNEDLICSFSLSLLPLMLLPDLLLLLVLVALDVAAKEELARGQPSFRFELIVRRILKFKFTLHIDFKNLCNHIYKTTFNLYIPFYVVLSSSPFPSVRGKTIFFIAKLHANIFGRKPERKI
jgi:hypothetical protein